jgi:predicted MPP superfamily phosphohydrolase
MSLFLIAFLMLYGGMHTYAFIRVRSVFSPEQPAAVFLLGWMTLMTVAPLLVRFLEVRGFEQAARWVAWPGYIWMGSIFIFSASLLAMDTLRTAAWLSKRLYGTAVPIALTAAITCEMALFIALLAGSYSLYEAGKIRTEHLTVTTNKLLPSSHGIRLVQISDVHLGLLSSESRLESVLQAIKNAHPDILVSTGDLIDGRLSKEDVASRLNHMATMISAVPTTIGKFAVTGNHEYYAGLDQALKLTSKAGFTVLRNQSIALPNGITISGIDDPAGQRMGEPVATPLESELMQSVPTQRFQILLKHRPIISETSDGHFDLQLSGHVHKGQIFPFNLLVRLKFPIPCGTTMTQQHSMIHVSRGSGTWGPPMRLLAPPEVTVVDIIPAGS